MSERIRIQIRIIAIPVCVSWAVGAAGSATASGLDWDWIEGQRGLQVSGFNCHFFLLSILNVKWFLRRAFHS